MAKRSTRLELTLTKLYPACVASVTADPLTLCVCSDRDLLFLLRHLKKSILHRYYLNDLFAVDFIGSQNKRFQLNYKLISYVSASRLTLTHFVSAATTSATSIFASASWLEREIWDMFGVYFFNSASDLRRILTDYGFKGHPFRKDFPLVGYYELRYSEKKKRVISVPLHFQQDFRVFNLNSPWIKTIQD